MNKHYISAQELLIDSYLLADQVYQSGFRPHFIIGIWRGGAPVGIAIQEFFEYNHIETDHICVRTSAYSNINENKKHIAVHGLHYIVDNVTADDALLIVDDVFDTGRSIEALLQHLDDQTGANMPSDIRIAMPWYKPENNQTKLKPDYFLKKSQDWLVFPHEIKGLSKAEILNHKHELHCIAHLFNQD